MFHTSSVQYFTKLTLATTKLVKHLENPLGSPEPNACTLAPPLENSLLIDLYLEDEVRKAVFQMEHNKSPGPDGFLAEFYQNLWDVIKSDLLQLFACLHDGQLELFCPNFEEIILLPKCRVSEE